MISTRPYMIRAIHEWACENDLTPHLLVNALDENVVVPVQFVKDGQIVLNISPTAVQNLDLSNEWVLFSARFSGSPMNVEVPVNSVQAIYARENGQGIFFPEDDGSPEPEGSDNDQLALKPVSPVKKKTTKPQLKVVK